MSKTGWGVWVFVILATTTIFDRLRYEPWFQAIGMAVFFGLALYGGLLWATEPFRRTK